MFLKAFHTYIRGLGSSDTSSSYTKMLAPNFGFSYFTVIKS